MIYKNLGRTGLNVSELAIGTMTFGVQANKEESFKILDRAEEAGINLIDTADVYPIGRDSYKMTGLTEAIIGEWLKHKRDRFVLASKVFGVVGPGPNDKGLSSKHIIKAVEESLTRLQTDYLDLYMAHQFDFQTPVEETMSAFDLLVRQGKVRYIGISNWRAWQVMKANGFAQLHGLAPVVSVEPRYNLLFRMIEEDLVPMAVEEGIGIIPYNPLAGGLLTGKHKKEQTPPADSRFGLSNVAGELYQKRYWLEASFEAVDHYIEWCEKENLHPVTTAVRWVMQQKGITSVIIGASRASQLKESLNAVTMPHLSQDQLDFLNQLWFTLPRRHEFN